MTPLSAEMLEFVSERHLASLTLVRPDGRPHVAPVGFSWDSDTGLARVITWNGAVKAKLLERVGPLQAALCQVDGGRWVTLEGLATITADPQSCNDAVRRYAQRYSAPTDRGTDRRVIELSVSKVMGRA